MTSIINEIKKVKKKNIYQKTEINEVGKTIISCEKNEQIKYR